ncbi:MAG: redoxin domain-containing protein [Candidatus Helarchaeota archaeon]|nr:redoxin domain-containing protein [Candidatus Helarchaeota archaeon]
MKDKFKMVGTEIPEFSLPNSRGDRINIREFKGKNIIIVLLRGLMDPFCQSQVFRLGKEIDKFKQLNAEIYAITADRFENARRLELRYAKEAFPIYFDKTHEVVRMLHQEVKIFKLGRLPAVLVVDREELIRWAYYGEDLRDIPKNKEIFEVLEKL